MTAKVTSLVGNGGTIDVWSKAGVMWRESTAAGSTYAFMCTTAGNGNDFQWRTASSGGAGNKGQNGAGNLVPWVQIQKTGTTYNGFTSPDGTTWTQFGTVTFTTAANPLLGLAVCAHNNGGTSGDSTSVTATFTNVTITDPNGLYYWPLLPPTLAATVSGYNKIGLSWTDTSPSPITSYTVSRGTSATGPFTVIASNVAATTYTDMTATYPTTYYYVVQAVGALGTSMNSNVQSGVCLAPLINVVPTALQVAENGGSAQFTVTLAQSPTGTVTVPISSANSAQLQLTGGAPSINLTFPTGTVGPQVVTVTAQNVGIEAPPANYSVLVNFGTVTCTDPASPYQNYNSSGTDMTPVTVTIVPDAAGILANPASIATVNGGLAVQFNVSLATVPKGTVVLDLSVSDPALATVSPTQITTAGFNSAVPVTVTPLNANPQTTYIGPYDIVITVDPTSTDPDYLALGPTDVPVSTPVSLPPLDKVWKCGLLGAEGILALGLLAVWRRRRQG
jgi:hypothetical protein